MLSRRVSLAEWPSIPCGVHVEVVIDLIVEVQEGVGTD
jgi:hypothetical protein